MIARAGADCAATGAVPTSPASSSTMPHRTASDGVFAIIITIMVLELKVPHQGDLAALWAKTTLRP
ncbi:MAG: hypothetical protein CK533_09010 [Acidobacterium sp.]|nr:MAG: hypothetical protein CK533_09010 [Acidobacterium sp.]